MKFLASLALLGALAVLTASTPIGSESNVSPRNTTYGVKPLWTRDELVSYLERLSGSGSGTISGQHNREPNSDPSKWTRTARDITGKYPGLWGGDFLFLPDDVQHRQNMIDEAKNQAWAGSLVTLTWHACPPTVGETCNWNSDGILSHLNDNQWNDLIYEGGNLYNQWRKRIDTIVPYLRQLESEGIQVLFRPIHEMNDGWSWWGGRAGSEGSRKLYQNTHHYMTHIVGLTNLVWVWCVKDMNMDSIGDYWPGANYVDVASLDMWMKQQPTDSDYNKMIQVASGRPIALGEVGSLPNPTTISRQPRWAWFMVWAEYLKDQSYNTDNSVKNTVYLPHVKSRGEL